MRLSALGIRKPFRGRSAVLHIRLEMKNTTFTLEDILSASSKPFQSVCPGHQGFVASLFLHKNRLSYHQAEQFSGGVR